MQVVFNDPRGIAAGDSGEGIELRKRGVGHGQRAQRVDASRSLVRQKTLGIDTQILEVEGMAVVDTSGLVLERVRGRLEVEAGGLDRGQHGFLLSAASAADGPSVPGN